MCVVSILAIAGGTRSQVGAAGDSVPSRAVQIGEVVSPERLHIISRPGRYGLGPEIPGSDYAIVGNLLIRVNAETRQVQSIIRRVEGILD